MNVEIYSRKAMEERLAQGAPIEAAVISFFDPPSKRTPTDYAPPDYTGKCDRVFQVGVHDIDLSVLEDYGLTYETYLPEADALAAFIHQARADGRDIICQCEYGQSRSAACAAAICEYFDQSGVWIFADYRYYPNQLIFHKVYNALKIGHQP